jgi:hypothetical protein
MNSDVHPIVVALVLLLTGVAVGIWMWGSGVAASFGGPAALAVAPDGHRFVQIQNHLVEHDAKGAYLRTHDLEAMDVESFLGGFAFFANGDVLLRRGPDPRSFLDNLRAFGRATNRNSIVPGEPRSGMFRCELETSYCERFGKNGVDFKAAYSVYIDWETDEVYISDTTRHLLRKYSAEGVELAPAAGGFKFPNDLLVHDGQLLVADTNHHVIRSVKPGSQTFAEQVDSKDVVPAAAKRAGRTWPSRFARVGDQWWVNNMQAGMDQGGIYVFDDAWQYLRRLKLPPNADPISLLAVEDAVWVSDWNNDVVRQYSTAGEPMPNLESAGLEKILTASRQERRKYTFLSYGGVVLVVLLFLGLLVRGFALSMNKP